MALVFSFSHAAKAQIAESAAQASHVANVVIEKHRCKSHTRARLFDVLRVAPVPFQFQFRSAANVGGTCTRTKRWHLNLLLICKLPLAPMLLKQSLYL